MKNLCSKYLLFITLCTLFFILGVSSSGLLAIESPTTPENTLSLSSVTNPPQELFAFRSQIRLIAFIACISLIPFAIMMLTSFTRISIIFHFLRQALGSPQVPSNQIVIGLSLILTGFVMHPVINEIQENAITPYINNHLKNDKEVQTGNVSEEGLLIVRTWQPLRNFLLQHVREKDLELFLDIAHLKIQSPDEAYSISNNKVKTLKSIDDVPWYCIVPAFVMSELRLAFMIGFLLFLPFLIIDMVIASVLMSMGMMMLPPVLISTPFKLLLFILIDGWRLIIQQIVNGYTI